MGLPGPAGPPGVPGEDGDKVHIPAAHLTSNSLAVWLNYEAEPMIILFSRCGLELFCNDVFLCRVRLESMVRKVPREEKESM